MKQLILILHIIIWVYTILFGVLLFDLVISQSLTYTVLLEIAYSDTLLTIILIFFILSLVGNYILYRYEAE